MAALIEIEKEIRNYRIYDFLRGEIVRNYRISLQCLEFSKEYKIVILRMILFYLLKENTSYGFREIAILFSIPNHNKVFHSVKLLDGYIHDNVNKEILNDYKRIETSLIDFINALK
jgi:chromosomal replication initiation ATPase DnaA